ADVVGYLMPKVDGVALHALGEPRWRREHPDVTGEVAVAALLALLDALAGLHRAGVVVGDCNDFNVLVDAGARRVHLIDVDSYQLPGFPCHMFSERFVDPRLCDPAHGMVPVRGHDAASDWFAFAVMACRSLLWVAPWAGVHQPAEASRRCPPPLRALRRTSVLGPDIVYPRAARPIATLPDDVIARFRDIFERDLRDPFPRDELARLRLRRCPACAEEHARHACPSCHTRAVVPPAVVHGRLRWQPIARGDVAFDTYAIGRATPVWIEGGALYRRARLGPERIGAVLPNQTHAWANDRLGVGLYRAGGYAVGFAFRPDRGGLNDQVALPRIRGRLISADATIATDGNRAWLWLVTDAGTTCVVVGADASVIATDTIDAPWLAGVAGACAAGPHLFVPTDDGIARIEVMRDAVVQTRVFAETAPLVGSGDRLSLARGGICVLRASGTDALRLELA
ncbi:MAG: hypothetical protein KIT31_41720, partial [Deltaproteobacteria bacterium]|nr:hypothetical protein [Deltaproteobacteria bacterium]